MAVVRASVFMCLWVLAFALTGFAGEIEITDINNQRYQGDKIIFNPQDCQLYTGLLERSELQPSIHGSPRGSPTRVDHNSLPLKLPEYKDITPTGFAYTDIAAIEFPSAVTTPAQALLRVTTMNNDVIMGAISGGGKSAITWNSPVLGEVELKFDIIRTIELITHSAVTYIDPPAEDTVQLINGDTDKGVVLTLDSKALVLKSSLYAKEVTYKLSAIETVIFAPLAKPTAPRSNRDSLPAGRHGAAAAPAQADKTMVVLCRDGSRLSGEVTSNPRSGGLTSNAGVITLQSRYKHSYRVALEAISFIYIKNSRCTYLSDETPATAREYAWNFAQDDIFLWPYQRDKSTVNNSPLYLGGKRYYKGLGVHSNSELTYSLGGQSGMFYATAGLESMAETNGDSRASVQFFIYLDGKKTYESKIFKRGDAPEEIALPVSNAQEIKLMVTDGGDGFIHDRAAWAMARVVK